ncbi:hypothetical protein NDN08_004623 [Rhodosorus marinus]|uniref:Phosphatidic acid phosphatase type 2/haloperoxidase domain-containing protein n=1 Tax=Rhodosorus marinus TaxID=101924 RepID=A0AAV8UQY5_9RHOD|nr:hypothetical protein NDN08_004623 [Rhodosorus marinus]
MTDGWLRTTEEWDKRVSYAVWRWYQDKIGRNVPLRVLEWTGHGVVWYLCVLAGFFLVKDARPGFYALMGNLFVGLSTDLLIVVIIKPLARRKRPHYNPGKTELSLQSVDKFSFPSGHATRCAMVTGLVLHGYLVYKIPSEALVWATILWAITVMESRVMLGRHHVLDIVGGSLLGSLNAVFVSRFLSLNASSAPALRDQLLAIAIRTFLRK